MICAHVVYDRIDNLLVEILNLHADILLFQEVDYDLYEKTWSRSLEKYGYISEWGSRPGGKHGCAIFYKKSRFEKFHYQVVQFSHLANMYPVDNDRRSAYMELNRENIAQIIGLRLSSPHTGKNKDEPLGLIISNTHLFWDPRYRYVRLKQCAQLLHTLTALHGQYNRQYNILCGGDWNVTPDNVIYNYLTKRDIAAEDYHTFLTPAEHGLFRNDDEAESKQEDNGTKDAGQAVLQRMMDVAQGKTADNSSSSTPSSNLAILSLQQKLVTQADGSVKIKEIELEVDRNTPHAKQRIEHVSQLYVDSKKFPILHSIYSNYTSLVPSDRKSSIEKSMSQPYCRWKGEPPFTNYTVGFKGTLDYLFVPSSSASPCATPLPPSSTILTPTHILEIPTEELVSRNSALPDQFISSDHIAVACKFHLSRAAADSSTSSTPSSSSHTLASFSLDQFRLLLQQQKLNMEVLYVPTVGSTMDICKQAYFSSPPDSFRTPRLFIADQQNAGRGRVQGRQWSSPACANVYATIGVLYSAGQIDELRKINFRVSIAIVRAIEDTLKYSLDVKSLSASIQPHIKWPNDVWINGRKVSGILIDCDHQSNNEILVSIGVGVSI